MDRAGWQPGKAGCSRPAGLQPSRRPLEAGRWQLQLALLLLEGQADWKEEAQRLARPVLVRLRLAPVLARRRPVLARRWLVLARRRLVLVRLRLALALAPVLVRLRLALVLQQVPVLQLALVLPQSR